MRMFLKQYVLRELPDGSIYCWVDYGICIAAYIRDINNKWHLDVIREK